MHFLGLNGLPRGIPDYSFNFWYLNQICTLGAFMSFFSFLVFFLVLITAKSNNNT